MRLTALLLDRAPAEAIERLDAAIASPAPGADIRALRGWRGLARHRAGDPAGALADWTANHADAAPDRVAPNIHSPAPDAWPEPMAPREGVPDVVFLSGAPGSAVERVAQLLAAVVPAFRDDRFGATPPQDPFQNMRAIASIVSGEMPPGQVVARWGSALQGRGVDGPIIDWLPMWDNAYAAVLRSALPEARLLVALRDPRDMLLDWLAFDAPLRFRLASPAAAAEWLAEAMAQVATLHELDLVPHQLLRLDDVVEDPAAIAAQLSAALGIAMPPPPAHFFAGQRLAAGAWRAYSGLLGDAFAHLHPVAARLGYPAD